MKRKRHSLEFKIEAVRRMEHRGERSIAEVAESLSIAESQLYIWRKQHGMRIAPSNGETESVEVLNQKLLRENAELRKDRDALLKSIAVFAKDRK